MELLLIIWTIGLLGWTGWLVVANSTYQKAQTQLQMDRLRWQRYCENTDNPFWDK